MKPANSKARALLAKLEALAERGIDGEREAAKHKLARLKARLNFTAPDPADKGPDLFAGKFRRGSLGVEIYSFQAGDFDIANCVKWAIESATRIPCSYRNGHLLAEAAPGTAAKLADIAVHITESFRSLVDKFQSVQGVNGSDRNVFVMGLYDGMMNQKREIGQRLPGRAAVVKLRKGKKQAVTQAPGLHIHPYSIALDLGRQIRFSVPVENIVAEMDNAVRKQLEGVG